MHVQETPSPAGTRVAVLSPQRLIEAIGPKKLSEVAREAEERLERVLLRFETLH